ncbi:MAG: hypothetical protein ACXITV_06340 [Luteibaculaceae bacterium]
MNPHFGFLFFVEGERNNHFIWELLNSNATYIWSFEKYDGTLAQQLKKIEEIIGRIRTLGREKYKGAYRNFQEDGDLVFRSIAHENINSDFVDDFPRWRSRLEQHLV